MTKSDNVAECKYEAIALPRGALPIASAISMVEMDTKKIKQLGYDPALLNATFH
ncbi:hypothetical protein [Nostoc sp. LEGE 12450]|uniref:hypothetical protein n=1 Tax=Nostoc sp. LEGE 12450 TaxID=1828643 RepID=UPI0018822DF0|nr:hypothetical protein [Nostoc sp. LEGE 12450]MBE8987805.1 hypothetical protein [Nostoc sp. LEGE 12450]